MGTNYYHVTERRDPCECCGRPYEESRTHIGKSSFGWCFSLHVIPEQGINTLEDWEARWAQPGTWIVNEYRDTVTVEELRKVITERSHPAGLLRHPIGRHCVGHGEGTWDYIAGEFS